MPKQHHPAYGGGDKINPGDTPSEVPVTPVPEVPPPD
jgi:hypothetical protein